MVPLPSAYQFGGLCRDDYNEVLKYLSDGVFPSRLNNRNDRNRFHKTRMHYDVRDGLLTLKSKYVVIRDETENVLRDIHNTIGHDTFRCMRDALTAHLCYGNSTVGRHLKWKMQADINHIYANCPTCVSLPEEHEWKCVCTADKHVSVIPTPHGPNKFRVEVELKDKQGNVVTHQEAQVDSVCDTPNAHRRQSRRFRKMEDVVSETVIKKEPDEEEPPSDEQIQMDTVVSDPSIENLTPSRTQGASGDAGETRESAGQRKRQLEIQGSADSDTISSSSPSTLVQSAKTVELKSRSPKKRSIRCVVNEVGIYQIGETGDAKEKAHDAQRSLLWQDFFSNKNGMDTTDDEYVKEEVEENEEEKEKEEEDDECVVLSVKLLNSAPQQGPVDLQAERKEKEVKVEREEQKVGGLSDTDSKIAPADLLQASARNVGIPGGVGTGNVQRSYFVCTPFGNIECPEGFIPSVKSNEVKRKVETDRRHFLVIRAFMTRQPLGSVRAPPEIEKLYDDTLGSVETEYGKIYVPQGFVCTNVRVFELEKDNLLTIEINVRLDKEIEVIDLD